MFAVVFYDRYLADQFTNNSFLGPAARAFEAIKAEAQVTQKPDRLQGNSGEQLRRRMHNRQRHEIAEAGKAQHQAASSDNDA